MHQVGRALRGKLIVAQADSDGSACKIKAVHLLQSFSGLGCITEPEISQLEFVSSIHERKTKEAKSRDGLLNKSVSTATAIIVLLELNIFQFTKWLKDGL